MKIFVNGKLVKVDTPRFDLALIELGFSSAAIATAVNGTFIAAANRRQAVLVENDQIEVLSPMQGG